MNGNDLPVALIAECECADSGGRARKLLDECEWESEESPESSETEEICTFLSAEVTIFPMLVLSLPVV